MLQVARNVSDAEDGFLREKKYLLMDRDTKFSEEFRGILGQTGVKAVRLPPRSPNLNPNLERFIRSIKEECLERIIFFGEKSLQNAVANFLTHYHQERNHQGLNNQLLQPGKEVGCTSGDVACRERLGGNAAILLSAGCLTHPLNRWLRAMHYSVRQVQVTASISATKAEKIALCPATRREIPLYHCRAKQHISADSNPRMETQLLDVRVS